MAAEDGEQQTLMPVAEPIHAAPVTATEATRQATANVAHADAREWGSTYSADLDGIPEARADPDAQPPPSSHSFQTFGLTKTTYPRNFTDIGASSHLGSLRMSRRATRRSPHATSEPSRSPPLAAAPGWAFLFYGVVVLPIVGGFVYVRFFDPGLYWEASNFQYISNDKVPHPSTPIARRFLC